MRFCFSKMDALRIYGLTILLRDIENKKGTKLLSFLFCIDSPISRLVDLPKRTAVRFRLSAKVVEVNHIFFYAKAV